MGKIYRRIVLDGGTNDQNILSGEDFDKMHFPVIQAL